MIRTKTIFDNQFCGGGAELVLANHFVLITTADAEMPVVRETQQYGPTHKPAVQTRWIVTSENGRPQLRMSWTAVPEQQACGTREEEK